MEAKKWFAEAPSSGSQKKAPETNEPIEVDPSILTTFLETFMKLLRDSKDVKGLQELIKKCDVKENASDGHHVV